MRDDLERPTRLSDYNAIPRPPGLDPEVHGPPLLDGSWMFAGADSGAAKLPTGTRCHCVACGGTAAVHLTAAHACPDCALFLPVLKRWVAAIDEVDAVGSGLAECDEYAESAAALEALAREVAHG